MKKVRSGQGRGNVPQAPAQPVPKLGRGMQTKHAALAYLYLTVFPNPSKNALTHPTDNPCGVPRVFVDPQLYVFPSQKQGLAAE